MIQQADRTVWIDGARMVQQVIELRSAAGITWQVEAQQVQPHPIQTRRLGFRKRTTAANHDGLEFADSDLQSMFKKPDGNGAKLGHGKRFATGVVSTGSGRRAGTAVKKQLLRGTFGSSLDRCKSRADRWEYR
jgi:hypothetical protein